MLPPPPGLVPVVSKPPPGFTGIALNSNVVEPTVSVVNRLENLSCPIKGFRDSGRCFSVGSSAYRQHPPELNQTCLKVYKYM